MIPILFYQQAATGTGKLARTLQDFLINQPAQVDFKYLIFSLILSAILGLLLAKLYIRYGTMLKGGKLEGGKIEFGTLKETDIVKTNGKIVKIKLSDNQIVEGEIIEE